MKLKTIAFKSLSKNIVISSFLIELNSNADKKKFKICDFSIIKNQTMTQRKMYTKIKNYENNVSTIRCITTGKKNCACILL